jgi:hypothetical protein
LCGTPFARRLVRLVRHAAAQADGRLPAWRKHADSALSMSMNRFIFDFDGLSSAKSVEGRRAVGARRSDEWEDLEP